MQISSNVSVNANAAANAMKNSFEGVNTVAQHVSDANAAPDYAKAATDLMLYEASAKMAVSVIKTQSSMTQEAINLIA